MGLVQYLLPDFLRGCFAGFTVPGPASHGVGSPLAGELAPLPIRLRATPCSEAVPLFEVSARVCKQFVGVVGEVARSMTSGVDSGAVFAGFLFCCIRQWLDYLVCVTRTWSKLCCLRLSQSVMQMTTTLYNLSDSINSPFFTM